MKNLRKVTVLVLALLVVFAFSATAFAATITVTPPANTEEGSSNTYVIYKVFDAVASDAGVSYKLIQGQTTAPDGFTVDDAGNVYLGTVTDTAPEGEHVVIKVGGETKYLVPQEDDLTPAQIQAIAEYIEENNIPAVGTKTVTGTNPAEFGDLPTGYYYITTTTGTAVIIKTASDEIEVDDKNTVPVLDKRATGEVVIDEKGKEAIAQVGTDVSYEATITVGKGAQNYVFHDTMTAGLALKTDSVTVSASPDVDIADWYTIKETPDEDDTLTITFKDGIPEGTIIKIKYSATITSDALHIDAANNTATVSYGDENGSNSTPPSVVEVYNAKITVDKKDGNGEALAGAGFVLKNAEGKYYKYTAATETAPATVEWVNTEAEATELITAVVDGKAQVAFTGLGAGTYTLHEKTVPEGYNGAADVTIKIEKDSTEANLSQTAEVTNNAGSELPTTGGVGTTIFYILGVVLVAGCGVVLVSRKRMSNK